MNEERPNNLKIGGTLLKSTLGFLLLYFGIKMYFAVPELEELDHTTGTFMFAEKGIRLEEKNFNMLMVEEFHYRDQYSSEDSLAMTNITKADEIAKQLSPGDKITFCYPQRTLPSDRGKEMLQFSVNDKVIVLYTPNRIIPVFMIIGGAIVIILFVFVVRELLKPKTNNE
jgi:hypothetical protein